MRGRKVIFAFIWPLLPNSLDCGQNIYRGAIKVIHRHRKSQPFGNSVKIKHCLSFFHLHFSPELSKAKCQPRIFFRFSVRLSLITLIIYPIFDLYDSQQDLAAKWQQTHTHTQQMSNNCRARRVYQARRCEQWCHFNNTRPKWVAQFHMTHTALSIITAGVGGIIHAGIQVVQRPPTFHRLTLLVHRSCLANKLTHPEGVSL